jgi:hypothetical protein
MTYNMKGSGFYGKGNSSPAKQGYTPHKQETHEERLNRTRKEKEKQHGTGYTPHKEETHEEKLARVRKEKEKQHGTGYDPVPKTYGPKKKSE